ncbi:tripartite tricarboxylate transporter substrate binding protein [Polaromonas sp.]|uniref:Bug family tripartite tricarboxylate transporter substrate binding protein n=1 Tax=Polaromonas sp. TaxID=1869339 RepID=UPI00286B093A|nr:tripartite tricarboxylate transporter substrate binding protein [Polaromonas sp.]
MLINRRNLLASSAFLYGLPSWAADPYPSKPVRFMTPNSAGSGADGMTRRLADHLGRALSIPFFVENIPGAGGVLGSENLVKSDPDGYTLSLISSNYVVFPHLYKKLSFNALKDITAVAGVAKTPMVLVTRSGFAANTAAELRQLAQREPEKITLGSSGNGTILHLAGMLMQEQGKFKLTHVPYKGAGPVVPDLVSGIVDVAFFSYASVEGLVKQGRLKVLGVSSAKRVPELPDVPALAETFPGCVLDAWYAVVGPKGMPNAVVQKLNKAITATIESDAFRGQIRAEGAVPLPMSPDALQQFLRDEYAKHGELVSRSGAVIQ